MKKYIILFSLVLLAQFTFSQGLSIRWPIDKSVFQRNNGGTATVTIIGQCPSPFASNWQLQYKIMNLDKMGNEISPYTLWTNLSDPGLGKTFRLTPTLPTGWYKLHVRILEGGFGGENMIHSTSHKFGVGEVFIIAGQSNAAGEDTMPTPNFKPVELILSLNI